MVSPIPPAFLQAFQDERQHAASDIDEQWAVRSNPTGASRLLDFLEEAAPKKLQILLNTRFTNRTARYNWLCRPINGNQTGREVILDESLTQDERFEILYSDLIQNSSDREG